jgi:SAM-dependent methyltransferase
MMTNILFLLIYGVNLILLVLAALWIFIPVIYGLPSKPTNRDRVRRALRLVDLKQGETLLDLGAGDGRVLFIAAKEFGAKAIGVEIGPVQCLLIWLRARWRGAGEKIEIRWGDFYRSDVGEADVVFIYATSTEVKKIAPYLKNQMKAGSRLVSISADFAEWEPNLFDEEKLIFGYIMPPTAGSITTYLLKSLKE